MESPTFYRLGGNPDVPGRWYLKAPVDGNGQGVDPRLFTEANAVDATSNLHLPLRRSGSPLDFTLADFDMPVISEPLARVLMSYCPGDVQLLEVAVETQTRPFFIANVRSAVACIAEAESEILWWDGTDACAEKIGTYRMITRPVLTSKNHSGQHLFRARGWEIMLLATSSLKSVLHSAAFTGLQFLPMESSDVRPNHSIERTPSGKLRLPKVAAHVKR